MPCSQLSLRENRHACPQRPGTESPPQPKDAPCLQGMQLVRVINWPTSPLTTTRPARPNPLLNALSEMSLVPRTPRRNKGPRDEIMQSHIGVAKSRHRTASRTGRISMRPCPPGGGGGLAQPRPRAPNPVRRWLSSAGLTEPSVALLGSRPTKPGLGRVRESSPPRASDRVREGGREGPQ